MDSKTIRDKFIKFFVDREHKQIPPAKLVPENDPTTLFTSSGMQPLVPYLLGQEHPEGKRLVNSQPSFRAEDIEEVGDNRHTTFFEMLGNWSLGDYFKKEQLKWIWEFLTKELGLDQKRLHVTFFEGNDFIPKDEETFNIWKELGIPEDRIYPYGIDKNWWSRSGAPDKMPIGEVGGTDSEIFYEFPKVQHDLKYGEKCHPHCDCGHFLEIGNSVFIEYKKVGDDKFEDLPQKNVDFGGGLERMTAASNDNPDVFQTDLYKTIIDAIAQLIGKRYETDKSAMQVIADHLKAATFMIFDGVKPSNKLQGYVLRRLLRRAAIKMRQLNQQVSLDSLALLIRIIRAIYEGGLKINWDEQLEVVEEVVKNEMGRFAKTLDRGLKEVEKIEKIDGKKAFDLYQTFGFPYEVIEELFRQKGQEIDKEQFKAEFEKHRELSRTASSGMFKGGLADTSEIVTKYHTATHLLHQALRDVLGPEVFQKGSNITSERLRFDLSFNRKMTEDETKAVEDIINQKIKEDLVVDHKIVSLDEAKSMNAIGLFDEKYANFQKENSPTVYKVSIYGVGPGYNLDTHALDTRVRGGYYSLEFCGGPHVEHTGLIGGIKITKEEAVSAGIRRIRAQLSS